MPFLNTTEGRVGVRVMLRKFEIFFAPIASECIPYKLHAEGVLWKLASYAEKRSSFFNKSKIYILNEAKTHIKYNQA